MCETKPKQNIIQLMGKEKAKRESIIQLMGKQYKKQMKKANQSIQRAFKGNGRSNRH